jgi:uncharacterized protein YjbJ (UPF0337 family)
MTTFGRRVSFVGNLFALNEMVTVVHSKVREGRDIMNPSTKDQIEGTLHQMKGKIKEVAGQASNNPDLAAEGQAEKLAGTIQEKVGQIEKVFEK